MRQTNKLKIPASLPETGFLRLSQVVGFVPIGKSTVWARVREGTFPAPIKLSVRTAAWRAEDIRLFIEMLGKPAPKA